MREQVTRSVQSLRGLYLGTREMDKLKATLIDIGFKACGGTFCGGDDSKYFVHNKDRSIVVIVYTSPDTGVIEGISLV